MPIAPPALVVGAARLPLPYGLFSTLTFRTDGRWENGTQFETATCEPADGIGQVDCADGETTATGLPKNLDKNGGQLGEASPFTVYGHFNCSPVGFSVLDAENKAIEHLQNREEARVEQALWTGDLGNVPSLQGADTTSLTTAATTGAIGIGLLEEHIAKSYGSLGVIHLTRSLATYLLSKGLLETKGNRLQTPLGTPVVAGAGYPGTGPAGEAVTGGQSWAFATPALFGFRSEVFLPSNVPGDLFDKERNDLYAVAERNYLLGFDPCGVGAALIDQEAGGGGMGAPGKSAYEIAVDNDFAGTEVEWLESLKSTVAGPPGKDGADSTVPGPPGKDGADSTVPGPTGPPGKVQSIIGGTGITVDASDENNPIINADGV